MPWQDIKILKIQNIGLMMNLVNLTKGQFAQNLKNGSGIYEHVNFETANIAILNYKHADLLSAIWLK